MKQQPWSKSNRLVKKTEKKDKAERFGGKGSQAGENSDRDDDDLEDDLQNEARLVKKLKQGKISREQFDKETAWGGSDGDDDDSE